MLRAFGFDLSWPDGHGPTKDSLPHKTAWYTGTSDRTRFTWQEITGPLGWELEGVGVLRGNSPVTARIKAQLYLLGVPVTAENWAKLAEEWARPRLAGLKVPTAPCPPKKCARGCSASVRTGLMLKEEVDKGSCWWCQAPLVDA